MPTPVQTIALAQGGYGSPLVRTFASLPAVGDTLIVEGSCGPYFGTEPTTVQVTDNQAGSNTWTVIVQPSGQGSFSYIAWKVVDASASTYSVSVYAGAPADAAVSAAVQQYPGEWDLDQTNDPIEPMYDGGDEPDFSVVAQAPNSGADRLVIALMTVRGGGSISTVEHDPPITGYTSLGSRFASEGPVVIGYKDVSSTETSSASFGAVTWTGGRASAQLATFASAGGGGTTVTEVTSLSMAVQLARSASVSVGLAVQAPQVATTSVSMAVRAAQAASASAAAAVQQAAAATALISVAVRDARSTSLSTSLAVQAVRQASSDLALAVQLAQSAGFGIDLQVQAASQASTSVSLQVQAGASVSAAVQVAVQNLVQASTSLSIAVSRGLSVGTSVGVGVQASRNATTSADLAIRAGRSAAVGVDAQIQGGSTVALALEAAVQFAVSASTAVSAAVAQLQSAGVGLSAAISLQNSLGVAIEAAVLSSVSRSFGVSIYIEGDDPPETYPLAGFTQGFPLAGQAQTYPLAR